MSMAAYGLGIVVAPVIGPTLGGWLTDTFSWRYAFYINIPVGILAVFMITRFVHDPPYIKNAKVGAFDNIGFGLLDRLDRLLADCPGQGPGGRLVRRRSGSAGPSRRC
jgi:MFS family permease